MGPNGAGKSTVLKAMFGLVPTDTGAIYWKGTLTKPVTHKMVQTGLAFVPQGRRVFTHLTVEQNLQISGEVVQTATPLPQRITSVFEIFPELHKKRKAKSGTLSGGQQQMLALGRGLMCEPDILLLDEPSLGLAPKLVKEVFAKIKEINVQKGTAIIVVEHNLKSLLEIVDRAYVLDKGRLILEETGVNLQKGDTLQNILLGRI
jgi:branched-chain amino acid transport system ATP-binding protein